MADDDLLVVENWVTPLEEDALCAEVLKATRGMRAAARRAVRYGPFQPYNHGVLRPQIPAWLDVLVQRLWHEGFMKTPAQNAQINLYAPGQGLAAHIDTVEAGDEIAVLSLMHHARMRWTFDERAEVRDMPARSLVLMRGARRWQWKHEVLPVDETRVSIVFRYRNAGATHASGTNS